MSKAQKALPWLPGVLQPPATLGAVSGAEHQLARGAPSILLKASFRLAFLLRRWSQTGEALARPY